VGDIPAQYLNAARSITAATASRLAAEAGSLKQGLRVQLPVLLLERSSGLLF
jgi:hypothetical protein